MKFTQATDRSQVFKPIPLNDFEKSLLRRLAMGHTQQEISEQLSREKISPNSRSSIEKKLAEIKSKTQAKTLFHLAYIANELELF